MFPLFVEWANRWANVGEFVGLALTLVGFIATLFGVFKSKSAAERAATAAAATRASLIHANSVADMASTLAAMAEIKTLHRVEAWAILPDRYSTLRQRLSRLRSSGSIDSDEGRAIIQGAIDQFAQFEQKVELALAQKKAPPNPAKLNQLVATQVDRLEPLLQDLQRRIGS
jgi:hypothetical protein